MPFKPIEKMLDRVAIAKSDSDTSFFYELLYLGEMIVKVTTAGLVAAVSDDIDRHRYRQIHRLVRAESLGEWSQVIDEVLTGPASQFLTSTAKEEQRELTQKSVAGSWQYEAVSLLGRCLEIAEAKPEGIGTRVSCRRWFPMFVELRNKTRGHGAPVSNACSMMCPVLEESVMGLVKNFRMFHRSWSYLHRNLSGKYRVTPLGGDDTPYQPLKSSELSGMPSLVDGVYVYLGDFVGVELIKSTPDATDFYLPNGGFKGKSYELFSYITGSKAEGDGSAYLTPSTALPPSETQGLGLLDIQGQSFGNLPPFPRGYINRQSLEEELNQRLSDNRHPIITLVGRGGIGKTSLALSVLHKIAEVGLFEAIFWFSARDIDLILQGPKPVKPHVLSERDVAKEFVRLMAPATAQRGDFEYLDYLSKSLTKSPTGKPFLYVFDNFETVKDPLELFVWLDSYIRLPNKVLITTRLRDFKGDYPVEVLGMTEPQSNELITATAGPLGVMWLLTQQYRQDVYKESGGHPYVIKVLLGEVAKANQLVTVERIVAGQDELLDALFERTYSGLSPVAKRVFLTLSNWRSTVPQLAVEAVLLRPENDRMDVEAAIEELIRSSFVEASVSQRDNEVFVSLPLVASIFGKRKLAVSPHKHAVEADTEMLHAFGASQPLDIKHGVAPRVERLFRNVARRVVQDKQALGGYLPMLEFIARKYPPAWLHVASLHEESGSAEEAKRGLQLFLESSPGPNEALTAWQRYAAVCQSTSDHIGEIHALVEMCQVSGVPFDTISDAANRINRSFSQHHQSLDTDEKRVVVKRLVEVMENRLDQADATDLSRLAWLSLHLRDEDRARRYTQRGKELDPFNIYISSLLDRFGAD